MVQTLVYKVANIPHNSSYKNPEQQGLQRLSYME